MPGDPATDDYIENMDQAPGIFRPEIFRSPPFAQFTADAKDVVRQLRDAYNSGNPDAIQAVQDYEQQRFKSHYPDTPGGLANAAADMQDFGSGQVMSRNRAWDLFYQAHQRYIGSALAREDPMSPETQSALEDMQGFDMGGSRIFNFDPLIEKGIIKPRNVPDYVPRSQSPYLSGVGTPSNVRDQSRPQPQQNVIDFDKLFKSGR